MSSRRDKPVAKTKWPFMPYVLIPVPFLPPRYPKKVKP